MLLIRHGTKIANVINNRQPKLYYDRLRSFRDLKLIIVRTPTPTPTTTFVAARDLFPAVADPGFAKEGADHGEHAECEPKRV